MKLTTEELEYIWKTIANNPVCRMEASPIACDVMRKISKETARQNEKKRKAEADVRFTRQTTEGG